MTGPIIGGVSKNERTWSVEGRLILSLARKLVASGCWEKEVPEAEQRSNWSEEQGPEAMELRGEVL